MNTAQHTAQSEWEAASLQVGSKIAVFGTLRSGQALSDWFDDPSCFLRHEGTSAIDASLFYYPSTQSFPVVRLGTGERTIVEIVEAISEAGVAVLADCLQMEQNAGYTITTVRADCIPVTTATCTASDDVLVCGWDGERVGAAIEGNDWLNGSWF